MELNDIITKQTILRGGLDDLWIHTETKQIIVGLQSNFKKGEVSIDADCK